MPDDDPYQVRDLSPYATDADAELFKKARVGVEKAKSWQPEEPAP